MQTCECGGRFEQLADLDGLFCNECGKHIEGVITFDESDKALRHLYSEDRAKVVRGVPMHYLKLGSETKGRIEISIPCYATNAESVALVDKQLALMKYAKDQVEVLDLDIFTGRK